MLDTDSFPCALSLPPFRNLQRVKYWYGLRIEVGAGFIPARSSNRGGLRAGINPAPTNEG
jgi:hypothetical protein